MINILFLQIKVANIYIANKIAFGNHFFIFCRNIL